MQFYKGFYMLKGLSKLRDCHNMRGMFLRSLFLCCSPLFRHPNLALDYTTAKALVVGPLLARLPLLFFLELLFEFIPNEFAMALVALDMEFATELEALLTALIELLIADVTALVAVEAAGSSIEGIEGIDPLVKKELPMKNI